VFSSAAEGLWCVVNPASERKKKMGKQRKHFTWRGELGRALVLGFVAMAFVASTAAAWEPRKPIEWIVMAGRGGGADRISRLIQGTIMKHKWVSQPITVINKPGGAGAEALTYLMQKRGDPHVLMTTLNSFFTTPLLANLPVDYTQLTPIARIAMDTFQLWVHADTEYVVGDPFSFIEDCKKKVGECKVAGTGKGQEDSIVFAMLEDAFSEPGKPLRFTYVPYPGGGRVAKALLGQEGGIVATVNNPSEAIENLRAGKIRCLASFTARRIEPFLGCPTFKELGYDLQYYMTRSINAPGGITAEQKQYWVEVMKKFYDSQVWQSYMARKGLSPSWLAGEALTKFYAQETAKHKKLIAEMPPKRREEVFGIAK
jgi:tripartite-type tricarboxylate transporter receptor subunit TctC